VAAPPAAPPAELTSRLRMVTMRLSRLLRQQNGPELSPALVSALATVARGPVTLGRLAELESVQPPSMTRLVAKLEELGMVTRAIDGNDRRVSRLTITPAGAQVLAEVRLRRNEVLAARLTALDPADVAAIEAALPALERLSGVNA
ncbi:MAG TPA: MarR family transcriptional regulator, partial [Acidimicrobiales bacterium]|nr:MarR family transcriptional regulator [Acidimicrobiales bacterium]